MYVVEGMRHVQMVVGGGMRCVPEALEVVLNVLEVWCGNFTCAGAAGGCALCG